ncbi:MULTISPECIES: aldehyde dehydrogenase family protein [Brucella/Ochrobactrum group]|jgi:aldehyde dehydrogenase (NAD+)|uniref:aldehyde dehydrogenase (NAD(+)) n=1 Tax=Brucella pseudintermedia TaxID=370111 RepID=A0ABY5UFP2_9HYPH|nr:MULTISPECIES: aldehyde dehydrogenase family protein [Brucella/Ochrobactrum group]KAB2684569.1 aldehyde dehydrogenase family protein [Brucella pseudintermedia]MCO7727915.1 aldehyde dehydrogenase family protein [Brucella intermedia]NKE74733.1 aldehyde dehydrogenase family protein [Ochrobactrum sp. MC-1LL]TWG97664.1 aldehyde dehydrogenase (NAD+) [Ochrobactrum sp. J50]UWL62156.1 aldehyde dehydrogenase family protein [Brucella pseudintermedia]
MLQKNLIQKTDFYIDGAWRAPVEAKSIEVINPANEKPYAVISAGSAKDIDLAVAAARKAFPSWSETPAEERIGHIRRLVEIYETRLEEMAKAISLEMGAPITLARESQAEAGLSHTKAFIAAFENFEFEELLSPKYPNQTIVREPIGVCGLITPWNWPMNQIALKVIPALAVGCTVILKPSEIAPMSAMLFAEFVDQAGFPQGVFNLVNGEGAVVGEALSQHPDVDMMSFTGSTRAGTAVSRAAAATVKRVSLELGGKSPNIVFADADLEEAIARSLAHCFENTGQSCNAPTRMLVERSVYDKAVELARKEAEGTKVGDPAEEGDHIGPLSSSIQFEKVQKLIQKGIDEGARLVAGGPGRPEGFTEGDFVKPTVFADVNNNMTIAREEIFGPVLAMIPFDTEDEAIAIANDTPYGLAAYIQTGNPERAKRVARKLRAGMVQINGTSRAPGSPFGGYKQSGNGREGGKWGLEDFMEVKLISG